MGLSNYLITGLITLLVSPLKGLIGVTPVISRGTIPVRSSFQVPLDPPSRGGDPAPPDPILRLFKRLEAAAARSVHGVWDPRFEDFRA